MNDPDPVCHVRFGRLKFQRTLGNAAQSNPYRQSFAVVQIDNGHRFTEHEHASPESASTPYKIEYATDLMGQIAKWTYVGSKHREGLHLDEDYLPKIDFRFILNGDEQSTYDHFGLNRNQKCSNLVGSNP